VIIFFFLGFVVALIIFIITLRDKFRLGFIRINCINVCDTFSFLAMDLAEARLLFICVIKRRILGWHNALTATKEFGIDMFTSRFATICQSHIEYFALNK